MNDKTTTETLLRPFNISENHPLPDQSHISPYSARPFFEFKYLFLGRTLISIVSAM